MLTILYRIYNHHRARCSFMAVSPVLCKSFSFRRPFSLHLILGQPIFLFPWDWYCSAAPDTVVLLLIIAHFPFCLHVENNLTFIGPCIANIFAEYNQQDAKFHNLFISVRRCTCFGRFLRPSSGAQNCTYSVRYLSDQYCYVLLAWLAAGSSIGLTNTWRCMCSFELLMMDGKTIRNM